MSEDLYFLPLIARALESAEPETALRNAFREIRELGRNPQFSANYEMFQRFQEESFNSANEKDTSFHMSVAEGILEGIMTDLAGDTFKGEPQARESAFDIIYSRPEWRRRYEEIAVGISKRKLCESGARIILYCGGDISDSLEIPITGGRECFDRIVPGAYSLLLDSGLEIWSGELGEEHLLWSHAHPEEPMMMAADTDTRRQATPTLVADILDHTAQLRVYAGLESGTIDIEFWRK